MKEWETLIQIRIYSQDIWMEFETEKCGMLIMKKNEKKKKKKNNVEGIEVPNQENVRTLG